MLCAALCRVHGVMERGYGYFGPEEDGEWKAASDSAFRLFASLMASSSAGGDCYDPRGASLIFIMFHTFAIHNSFTLLSFSKGLLGISVQMEREFQCKQRSLTETLPKHPQSLRSSPKLSRSILRLAEAD